MKELFKGIWALLWALIVSVLMFSIGTVYSLGYSVWLSVTLKKWYAFFQFWWRLVDGFCAAIGHVLFETAYALDLGWNVNGEIIEDIVTAEENTTFSKKNISVSSSIGKLQIDGKLNPAGKKFSKALNFFFGQRQHAIDSWNFYKAKNELRTHFNK
jgi:hypothetical protein